MSHIAAFVGHSFVDADQKVVQSILDCLDGIKEIHPSFTWEHATHPEPNGVDEKVLRLFADKNLFIAICTKKEPVLLASEIKEIPFFGGYFFSSRKALQWKTSDWIIQEIGVAIGRGMRIILLMEEGVKLPGALQGNLEYITFKRDAPDACFTALMGMIAAITPRTDDGFAIRTEKTENHDSAPAAEEEPSADIEWMTPDATWDMSRYKVAFMITFRKQTTEASERISSAFYASNFAADPVIRSQWEAWKLLCKTRNGDTGALAALQQLVEASPNDAETRETLSRAYIDFGEHLSAATELGRAAACAGETEERLRLLRRQVEQLYLAKQQDAIPAIIERMRATYLQNQKGEEEILQAELGLAKSAGRDDIVTGCLERLVELEPANADHRFELAYKYSAMGESALAAMHYSRIPEAGRSGIVWNNLGVAFAALDMPGSAVACYTKAEELGETLATSNLALIRLEAGFQREAVAALNAALKTDNPHKNVLTSLSRAKALPEEEAEKQKQFFEKAAARSEFNRCYGNSLVAPYKGDISGAWSGPKCALVIKVDGDEFVASGTFQQNTEGGIFRAMMGLRADDPLARSEPWVFDVEYSGRIHGRSVSCELSEVRRGEDRTRSTLLSRGNTKRVYMWLDEDGGTLHAMQHDEGAEPSFYAIKRII